MTNFIQCKPTSFGLCIQGKHRDYNEDKILHHEQSKLWIICDGMGGHQFGRIASEIATNSIAESVLAQQTLSESLQSAHQSILDIVKFQPEKSGMGTTGIVLQLKNDEYEIAWVGDSRGYLFDGRSLHQITRDHSLVQHLLAKGEISIEEATKHPYKNIITQCLGSLSDLNVDVGVVSGRLTENQMILLCSDGVSSELTNQEIEAILCRSGSVEKLVNELVQAANSAGGGDNISAFLVCVDEYASEA